MSRYMKAEVAQVKSDATQNTTLAVDNDWRLKHGLMELEKQINQNGAATAELRADVQAVVQTIAQHPTLALATRAAPPEASEMQAMCPNLKKLALEPNTTSRQSRLAVTR